MLELYDYPYSAPMRRIKLRGRDVTHHETCPTCERHLVNLYLRNGEWRCRRCWEEYEKSLTDCRERCVANVDGRCAVEKCGGAIEVSKRLPAMSVEKAAEYYGMLKKACDRYVEAVKTSKESVTTEKES